MHRKLTTAQAVAIRAAYADPAWTQQRLADKYGVSQVAISLVVRGKIANGEVLCKVCGEAFGQDSPTHAYCSDACFVEGRRRRKRACWAAAHPKMDRLCPQCGASLNASLRSDAVYCSASCNDATRNATRKASWKIGDRQERVSRAYIIARDSGRCHLCRKKCSPAEIHLDHLIPLSRGGTHDPANVRVACADCNLSKRADARDDQLMLVG